MARGNPVNDDDDLAKRSRSDDFWIRRILKFTLLGCAVIILVGITIVIGLKLGFDEPFRDGMAEAIKTNATSIVIGVAAVLGVNLRGVNFKRGE
jgi:uncharacterized membrane protein YbhN (UPF0104 family)